MLLAAVDVRSQLLKRFHARWFETSDLREPLDFGSGQPNLLTESNHAARQAVIRSYVS
jgi:hypothetical protein